MDDGQRTTHDDGRQPTAISHSGDLKIGQSQLYHFTDNILFKNSLIRNNNVDFVDMTTSS